MCESRQMRARRSETLPIPANRIAHGTSQRISGTASSFCAILTTTVLLILPGAIASCGAAAQPAVSLDRSVRPIFMASCAFGNSCHGSPTCAGYVQLGPNSELAAEALVQGLVNVPSINSPNVMRVVPGNSGASLLVRKLSGDFTGLACGASACGARMPFGAAPLATDLIDTLARWVDQGAPLD